MAIVIKFSSMRACESVLDQSIRGVRAPMAMKSNVDFSSLWQVQDLKEVRKIPVATVFKALY